MIFDATARQRVAPGAEKQSHRLPADGFFAVLRKVEMTNTEWLQFWEDMRESGFIIVDAPARKIAVFGNTSGQIVIAIEDDGIRVLTTVCLDELSDLQGLLARAQESAFEIDIANQAEFAIWNAKRVRG